MALRFECTECGRCCHGLRLPLSIAEAMRWIERGGTVEILCDASPLDAPPGERGALRHARAFAGRSGSVELAIDLILVAAFPEECPNLLSDMRCGIYDERPATCRVYPAELAPGRPVVPATKRCPPEAWRPDAPLLLDDTGSLADARTASTIAAIRRDAAIEADARRHVSSALGIDAAALHNEGFAIWTPAADRLHEALRDAASGSDPGGRAEWSFVSNRAATRELIVTVGATVVHVGDRKHLSYLPFFTPAT